MASSPIIIDIIKGLCECVGGNQDVILHPGIGSFGPEQTFDEFMCDFIGDPASVESVGEASSCFFIDQGYLSVIPSYDFFVDLDVSSMYHYLPTYNYYNVYVIKYFYIAGIQGYFQHHNYFSFVEEYQMWQNSDLGIKNFSEPFIYYKAFFHKGILGGYYTNPYEYGNLVTAREEVFLQYIYLMISNGILESYHSSGSRMHLSNSIL